MDNIPREYILPPKEQLSRELYAAAGNGDLQEVKRLVIAGADLYWDGGIDGEGPLHAASANGYSDITDYLLYNGARVNAVNIFQQTALHKAAENGHCNVIDVIVKYKPSINTRDKVNGFAALHQAACKGHDQCAKALINGGAKVDAKCSWRKKTASELASQNGHMNVLDIIMEHKNISMNRK